MAEIPPTLTMMHNAMILDPQPYAMNSWLDQHLIICRWRPRCTLCGVLIFIDLWGSIQTTFQCVDPRHSNRFLEEPYGSTRGWQSHFPRMQWSKPMEKHGDLHCRKVRKSTGEQQWSGRSSSPSSAVQHWIRCWHMQTIQSQSKKEKSGTVGYVCQEWCLHIKLFLNPWRPDGWWYRWMQQPHWHHQSILHNRALHLW